MTSRRARACARARADSPLSQPRGVYIHELHPERRNYAANEGTFPEKVIFHAAAAAGREGGAPR